MSTSRFMANHLFWTTALAVAAPQSNAENVGSQIKNPNHAQIQTPSPVLFHKIRIFT